MDKKESRSDKLYNIVDKIKGNRKCHQSFIAELKDLTYSYLQENGFNCPLLIKDKAGLGMKVPSQNFSVNDIKKCIGSRKAIQAVMRDGRLEEMNLEDFVKHLETKREELSALQRFDFSGTKLESYVEQPEVVQQLDWMSDAGNAGNHCREGTACCIKLRRFCSLSLSGHFDDFGLSACSQWIHLLRGRTILWLVRPSAESYDSTREWWRSGRRTFLGDSVDGWCQKFKVEQGWTLLIPPGWITAWYATDDSLVIGGTFMNTLSLTNQIAAHRLLCSLDDKYSGCTHFQYRLWQVMEAYSVAFLGHSRLRTERNEGGGGPDKIMTSSNEDTDVEEVAVESEPSRLLNNSESNTISSSSSSSSPAKQPPVTHPSLPSGSGCNPAKSSSSSSSSSSLSSSVLKVVTVKLENCLLTQKQSKNEAKALSSVEAEGLRSCVEFLSTDEGFLGPPRDLIDPGELVNDIKKIIGDYDSVRANSSLSGKVGLLLNPPQEAPPDVPVAATTGQTDGQQQQQQPPLLPTVIDRTPKTPQPSSSSSSSPATAALIIVVDPSSVSATAHLGEAAGSQEPWAPGGRESVLRRRRVRCKRCEPCTRGECGECHFCRDMKKFGGQGKMKQTCVNRQCLAPILSTSAVCSLCGKGDNAPIPHGSQYHHQLQQQQHHLFSHQNQHPPLFPLPPPLVQHCETTTSSLGGEEFLGPLPIVDRACGFSNELMECSVCWKITHPLCFQRRHPELNILEAVTNDDLPNSWDCPGCCEAGKSGQRKPRPIKTSPAVPPFLPASMQSASKEGGQLSSNSEDEDDDSEDDVDLTFGATSNQGREKASKKVKVALQSESLERKRCWNDTLADGVEDKRLKIAGANSSFEMAPSSWRDSADGDPLMGPFSDLSRFDVLRDISVAAAAATPAAHGGAKVPVLGHPLGPHPPQFVVRPIPTSAPPKCLPVGDGSTSHPLRMEHWLRIFARLGAADLSTCMLVCRTWNCWCYYTPLWKRMDLSRRRIKKVHLVAVAKRQPEELDLSHAGLSSDQLTWMCRRLYRLRRLRLEGCSAKVARSLGRDGSCPLLTRLDLSWISRFDDSTLGVLLSPPIAVRPGVTVVGCRLQDCVELNLQGTEIGQSSLELLAKTMTKLQSLDLSYCTEVTGRALDFLVGGVDRHPSGKHQVRAQQTKNFLSGSGLSCVFSSLALVGGQPHCGQSIHSANSPASNSAGVGHEPPSALVGSSSIVGASAVCTAGGSVQMQLPVVPDSASLPLPLLKKLFLIGCSWIDGTVVDEARKVRPQLDIIHYIESL